MTNETTSAIDLVERLTEAAYRNPAHSLYTEAADTITRLQAALEPFAAKADEADKHIKLWGKRWHDGTTMSVKLGDIRKARDAYRSSVGGE